MYWCFLKNKGIIIAISFVLLCGKSFSQIEEQSLSWNYTQQVITADAMHVLDLGLGVLTSPTRIEANDFLYIGGAGAITSSLFLVDKGMKETLLRNRTSFNDKLFGIDEIINGPTTRYASIGIYLTGFLVMEENLRRTGLYALETLFIAKSTTNILKYLFGRSRPYASKDNMNFKIFRGSKGKHKSFPSGHTTSAFSFASVMAMSIDDIYWKSFWYGSAAMVGVSRIYHNVHWLSDTFLAAAISYGVANYVVNFEYTDENSISLSPTVNGLSVKVYF